MDYRKEYGRWLLNAADADIKNELAAMDDTAMEDAFCRELEFGTGGLRGVMGAGTNRMNTHVVARASQGLANCLGAGASVVIGHDSRVKSDIFARTAAGVLAANGVRVWIWPGLSPVPTVSYAVRHLRASAGVMVTASHNPGSYNGYKVYGADGCQVTTEAAGAIQAEIGRLDIFADIKGMGFGEAASAGMVRHIAPSVLTSYMEEVRGQSVLFGDRADRDVAIVYSPLNGAGLGPVMRVLVESGFTNVTVVGEQREPDGNFPTCPRPNPEEREAMGLGVAYASRLNADLVLATDPDCDRCGAAVRLPSGGYRLLTGNEVGLLLLDFICAQRARHHRMPRRPIFIKTIVTTDLAEKIAARYGVRTVNVLTGFKYIGEAIGRLEDASDFICGFEESCGYLTGPYVRDKDGVSAAFMVCEMAAYHKARGISLLDRLEGIYGEYGHCRSTLHSYEFPGSSGMRRMAGIMADLRRGLREIGGEVVVKTEDYSAGLNGLPKSDVMKFYTENGSVVVRPSGTEPKLKAYVSVTAEDREGARAMERRIVGELEDRFA